MHRNDSVYVSLGEFRVDGRPGVGHHSRGCHLGAGGGTGRLLGAGEVLQCIWVGLLRRTLKI